MTPEQQAQRATLTAKLDDLQRDLAAALNHDPSLSSITVEDLSRVHAGLRVLSRLITMSDKYGEFNQDDLLAANDLISKHLDLARGSKVYAILNLILAVCDQQVIIDACDNIVASGEGDYTMARLRVA